MKIDIKMASDLEALIKPGLFKASGKNPEKLLVKFNLYIEQVENFFIATGKEAATDKVKVAVLQVVGGARNGSSSQTGGQSETRGHASGASSSSGARSYSSG